ncbi:hypothetical protein cyc_03844 [Cyclospora cayetanensis]|nr:hypothetical protein cyc_03844 [Cyclospora cayetanensis]
MTKPLVSSILSGSEAEQERADNWGTENGNEVSDKWRSDSSATSGIKMIPHSFNQQTDEDKTTRMSFYNPLTKYEQTQPRRLRSGRAVQGVLSPEAIAAEVEETALHEGSPSYVQKDGDTLPELSLPVAGASAASHLQVGEKQIIDQLLTGMLGTGVNMMQGGGLGAQPAGGAAAPAAAFGPTPVYYAAQETGVSTVEIVLIISGSILVIGLVGLMVWLLTSKKKRRR